MKLSILGSTGSIGTQALDVCKKLNIEVAALTARSRTDILERQIREFKPKIAVVTDEKAAADLKTRIADTETKLLCGTDELCTAAMFDEADTVLNALVGMAGLVPTVAAITAGKTVALANKETLVAGGDYVMKLANENGVKILPVDSEHSAIFQCLQGRADNGIKQIILTASGGPFFDKTREQLQNVTKADALKHPNWDMGQKITVDSATMMNKGFELIEAMHLFGVAPEKVNIVVHRESVVHSAVVYDDNSVIAQMGVPDMRLPIQYALTYPQRVESDVAPLDLTQIGKLTFYKPDLEKFGCLKVCIDAAIIGGLKCCAVNAANEVAVGLFLQDKIGFMQIEQAARMAFEAQKQVKYDALEEVLECDRSIRELIMSEFA